jgi:hypothetical protein
MLYEMKDQDFINTLQFGKLYEQKAKEYVDHDECEQTEGKISAYDLIFKKDNTETRVEVKADRQAWRYHNICIEIESNNIPSGLSVTEADYWIYFIVSPDGTKDEVFKIPVAHLKNIVDDYINTARMMGYNRLSKCLLIPKDKFKEYKIS